MDKKINEISSTEFRTKLKQLGFSEKNQELTSGGELNSNFLNIINKFMTEWKQIGGSTCTLMFTSGNDLFHKNRNSRHKTGEAVDVQLSKSCHPKFINLLNSYKSKYNGFNYIDEYTHPSPGSTGGHFHISYRPNQPEGGSSSSMANYQSSEVDTTTSTGTEQPKPEFDSEKYVKNIFGLDTLATTLNANFKNKSGLMEEITKIKRLL